MLELAGLQVKTGAFTLKNINLAIEDGECHVIIGPTGCGKTTLLETIIGLRKPAEGSIWLDKKDITSLPIERRNLSYLPQDITIFPHMTVGGNILYGLKVQGRIGKGLLAFVDELIERLGISHLLKRDPRGLSGGERQRVALARAIAAGNKYFLLDEPFSSLHEGIKKELWYLIKELQERYGLTIVMVTHDLEEAFFLGDRISVMIYGKIHQTGSKDKVYKSPQTIETARFFGIKNLFKADVLELSGEEILLRCEEIHCNLHIPRLNRPAFLQGPRFIVGIRAEDVMFLRDDLKRRHQDNLITGKVIAIFKKGAYHTILFSPLDSLKNIEVELPNHAFQKLNLTTGQYSTIFLRKESIFPVFDADVGREIEHIGGRYV